MQTTESWHRDNLVATRRRGRCNSTTGSVLSKSEMSPVLVVVTDVLIQQPSQMSAIQHDHMIQEISTYTANPALGNSVLPRTAECGANRLALMPGLNVLVPIAEAGAKEMGQGDASRSSRESTRPTASRDALAVFVDAIWPQLRPRIEDLLQTELNDERSDSYRKKQKGASQENLPLTRPKR
jgi:hypothetical protein